MTAVNAGASQQAVVEAALVLLERFTATPSRHLDPTTTTYPSPTAALTRTVTSAPAAGRPGRHRARGRSAARRVARGLPRCGGRGPTAATCAGRS